MKMNGIKAFSLAFCLTAALLLPLGLGVYWLEQWRGHTAEEQAAHSESGIAMPYARTEHCMSVLVCVVGETPSFALLLLDAPNGEIAVAPIPAQGVLLNGKQTATLAQSYESAGPARVVQLLNETLGLSVQHYLAVTQSDFIEMLAPFGSVRTSVSGALTQAQLDTLPETQGAVQDWSMEEIESFLAELTQEPEMFAPESIAAVRGTLWERWLRDKLTQLPSALPEALRGISSRLLTDLSAIDYHTLGETLEFLANGDTEIQHVLLAGDWNQATERYEFGDETLAVLNASFSALASGTQCASSSAP